MSLYKRLQKNANNNLVLRGQLHALEYTLKHFRVRSKSKNVVADALLRFRIVKDNMALDDYDPLLGKLVQMDTFFSDKMREVCLC